MAYPFRLTPSNLPMYTHDKGGRLPTWLCRERTSDKSEKRVDGSIGVIMMLVSLRH
jgi:hypothetical protein